MSNVMVKVRRLLAIGCVVLAVSWLLTAPALAINPTNGAEIFSLNCAGCHVNGGNIVRRGKNLQLKTLQRNKLDSLEAVAHLVTNGKGIMSAYGDRLTAEEIEQVSAYVLQQANQGWK
jgi:cytochrome c6